MLGKFFCRAWLLLREGWLLLSQARLCLRSTQRGLKMSSSSSPTWLSTRHSSACITWWWSCSSLCQHGWVRIQTAGFVEPCWASEDLWMCSSIKRSRAQLCMTTFSGDSINVWTTPDIYNLNICWSSDYLVALLWCRESTYYKLATQRCVVSLWYMEIFMKYLNV